MKNQKLNYILGSICLIYYIFSLLPLLGMLSRPYSGFFYSPFYTNNSFTDAMMLTAQAGLRPEYRVVSVERQLIDHLQAETERVGVGNALYLVWEQGNIAGGISVTVEALSSVRLLEKALPFFIITGWLFWVGWRQSGLLRAALLLTGGSLLAATDYFLVNGAGLNSGFDPAARLQSGNWLLLLGKWSSYLYFPLWAITLAGWGAYLGGVWLAKHKSQRHWVWAVIIILTLLNLSGHIYSAILTGRYNNPNFTIFYSRGEFWVLWLPFTVVALVTLWLKCQAPNWRKTLASLGLILFVVGFVAASIFDHPLLPLIGMQWAMLGLITTYDLRFTIYD